MTDLRTTFYIFITFLFGLTLTIIPLPHWATWYRPAWMTLIVIYWALRIPASISLALAWLAGLMIDALYGNLLGLHAFTLTLMAYLTVRMQPKMKNFALLQESLVVMLLVFLNQLVICIIQGMIGELSEATFFWLPALTSTLMWPWVVLIFKSLPDDDTPKVSKPRVAFLD